MAQLRPPAENVGAILYFLAVREMVTVVPVPGARIDALPWGEQGAAWSAVAPGLVAALDK